MPRNNFFGCLFIFSSALNLFRRKKYLFSVAQYVLPMFLSCDISKCNWIRSGYSSKHFKRYISIKYILLCMGNFLGTPIIWFISSLFQKHADASFLPRQALLVITECKKCLLSKLSLDGNPIIYEENLSINSSKIFYKLSR